jgi:hypothetical protein
VQFDADLILLWLHAPGSEDENCREHRLARQVRSHFDRPTIVVYFGREGHMVGQRDGSRTRPPDGSRASCPQPVKTKTRKDSREAP